MELKSDRDINLMLVGLDTVDCKSSRLLKAAMFDEKYRCNRAVITCDSMQLCASLP